VLIVWEYTPSPDTDLKHQTADARTTRTRRAGPLKALPRKMNIRAASGAITNVGYQRADIHHRQLWVRSSRKT